MIDVYTWPTPNGHKVHIMLEECGLPYAVHPIDIRANQQFSPEYLAHLRARAESAAGSACDPVELIWMAFAHGWSHGHHAGTHGGSIGAPAAHPGTQV